jgi:FtsP/CotA-like multicopper oxidase with cupredoxin domain
MMKKIILVFMQLFMLCLLASAQSNNSVYTCPMHPEVQSAKPGKCPKCGMDLVKKASGATKKQVQAKKPGTPVSTSVVYTCPMHPEVQAAKPGKCPKCGMDLVKKTPKAATSRTTKTTAASKKPATKAINKSATDELREMMQEMKGMMNEMKTTVSELKEVAQQMKGGSVGSDEETMEEHQHHDMETGDTDTTRKESKIVYTCPMHPEVQSDKPGECPKCGMTLISKTVPINKQNNNPENQPQQAKQAYTCVMHPEVQQDKPGNCPKCGMTLIKKTVQLPQQAGRNDVNQQRNRADEKLVDEIVGNKVNFQSGTTVVYHLYVKDTIVNYTGKNRRAIAINGSIPSPTLTFTEGDTAEVWLHNQLKEETSIHWHGIILPNQFDGVPFLTTRRIGPGDTYVYKFKVVQNGTYWYHSHSALQEQIGMHGALILKKRTENEVGHTASIATNTAAVSNAAMDHNHAGMTGHATTNPSNTVSDVKHYNIVLSEWADENPMQTQRRLRTANDWFSIKKGSTQSYSEAIKEGHLGTKLLNEWKRMKAMDVSDDWYQRFLVNGRPEADAPEFKAGDKVILHIVNAGASSYFWLGYGGGKLTVVGNDGNEVMPVEVDRLIIAPAETYDLLVTIPDNMSYEFRATSEDRTGASSLWLGAGMKMPAPKLPRLKYFEGMKMMNDMMNVDGTMKDMGMNMSLQKMDMNMVMYPEITGGTGDTDGDGNNNPQKESHAAHQQDSSENAAAGNMNHDMHNMQAPTGGDIVTLNYNMLRAPIKTSLPEANTRVLHFTLTGNMNRYVWTLDNKTVTEADRIMINRGENLRIILTNNSMMRHPMHLHGHDFRVVNQYGAYSPLKNVIDIMPMETDTIEFAANQDGNWFFHCHILFHMMAGMGRVFTYANSPVNPDLPDAEEAYRKFRRHKDQNMKHLMASVGLESNGSDGELMLSTNRLALMTEWRIGSKRHHGLESETMFGRYIGVNQWLFPYVGFDYHNNDVENETEKNLFGQQSNQNNRRTFTAGVQYITPGLFLADARVDGNGKFRFQLSREDIPLTARLRLGVMGNTDKEYMAGLRYILTKWFALSTHYDSDMGFGAGVTLNY